MFDFVRSGTSHFVGQMSPAHVELLKAALLDDGDLAISAYREWRRDLDFFSLTYGQQRILPLLQRNLTRFEFADPLVERCRGIRRYFWVQNLKAMTFAKAVFAALDQAGVPFIVLKGAALVACYFHDRSLRPMSDIDLLIPEERLPDAAAVLEQLDLLPEYTTASQLKHYLRRRAGWQFVGSNGNMDLHWKALHLDRRSRADDAFWQGRRVVVLDDCEINVLDRADQLLHVCAHAVQSTAGGARFQWPADAAFIIGDGADVSFERLLAQAERHRLSGVMANALEFLAVELNVPIDRKVIAELYSVSHWDEHFELRALADQGRGRISAPTGFFLEFMDFRRSDGTAPDLSMNGSVSSRLKAWTGFLKAWTGVTKLCRALVSAVQAVFGRPPWLRRILGRDAYREATELSLLPRIGDTLNLAGAPIEETPLIFGWSTPEPTGRWTLGHEATIAWAVDGPQQGLTLSIDGYALQYEGAPLPRIHLCLNDRKIATWRFPRGSRSPLPAEIPIAAKLLAGKNVAYITFLIKSPRCPAEFGLSDDCRPMGLHLRSISLKSSSGSKAAEV